MQVQDDQKSIARIVQENFKREAPKMFFRMIGIELFEIRWMYITGALFLFGLWLYWGDLLPAVI